jgi:hypothetical protein
LLIGVAALVAAVFFLRAGVNTFAARRLTAPDSRLNDAIAAGVVARTTGAVAYDVLIYLDHGSVETFAVSDITFSFNAERHSALLDAGNLMLIVYYLPGVHEIVAAEPA